MSYSERVYSLCRKIPKGKVATYKAIARALNSSPRAVGRALRKNPYAPEVPCHRVIKSDGNIGGFKGSLDNQEKINLLIKEGVEIRNNKISPNLFLKLQWEL